MKKGSSKITWASILGSESFKETYSSSPVLKCLNSQAHGWGGRGGGGKGDEFANEVEDAVTRGGGEIKFERLTYKFRRLAWKHDQKDPLRCHKRLIQKNNMSLGELWCRVLPQTDSNFLSGLADCDFFWRVACLPKRDHQLKCRTSVETGWYSQRRHLCGLVVSYWHFTTCSWEV